MSTSRLFLRIGSNTLVQILGKAISVILSLITVALITRYLGQDGYGIFSLAFAYTGFFSIFADFGLQIVFIRELSLGNFKRKDLHGSFFGLKILLVLVSVIFSIILLLFFPYSAVIRVTILIAAVGVGMGNFNTFGTTVFQSQVNLKLVAISDLLSKLATTAFIIFFVYLKLPINCIVAAVFLGNLASAIFIYINLNKYFNLKLNYPIMIELIKWSIPVGFTSFIAFAYFNIDTIILSFFRHANEVGVYSLAYNVLENLLLLWGYYMASVYPLLSSFNNVEKQKQFNALLKTSILVALVSSVGLLVASFILSPFIVYVLGGKTFDQSIYSLRILIFALPFLYLNNLLYFLLVLKKQVNRLTLALVGALAINLMLNFIYIPRDGYIAASVITVITEVAFFLLMACAIVLNATREHLFIS